MSIQEKLDLRDRLRRELQTACERRGVLTSWVETPHGRELESTLYERHRMLELVNLLRAARGRAGVTADRISDADRRATGYVDWVDKFPLYCAELVLDEETQR